VRPALAGVPKALVPVQGKPFLCLLLDQLADADVSRVVICAGHLGDRIEELARARRQGPPIEISRDDWPMGSGGALRRALPYLDGSSTVLVAHGDTYVDTDLSAFRDWGERQPYDAALLVNRVENCASFDTLELDLSGTILSMHPPRGVRRPGWVAAGISLLPRSWIESLPEDIPLSLEHDILPYWIERGIGGYCVRAPFLDLGEPEHLPQAHHFFATLRRRLSDATPKSVYVN
jgi:NDP-sugar pyrophosphorylase family protein